MAIAPFTPVTREEAARILSVSLGTLDAMIEAGELPAPRSLGGRRLYWHPDVFYGWLDKLLRGETNPAADSAGERPAPSRKLAPKIPSSETDAVEKSRVRNARKLAELNG